MIKQLIEDLTYGKITLSQALTRAKIIAYKLNNNDFKEWITCELSGYDSKELPNYRIIKCEVFVEINNPYRGIQTIPFDVTNLDKDLNENSFYKMNIVQSIPTLENGLKKDEQSDFGYEYLPIGLVQLLKNMVEDGENITAVKRRIYFSEIRYIIELTKQKLLDILLQLHDTFPNLENEFNNSSQNTDKVQNIITHNVYGGHSNTNIGIGENITQTLTDNSKVEKFIEDIKKMGIEDEDIKQAQEILTNEKDKVTLGKKMMTWVGKVSTKAIEKGIELQLPLLIEKLHDLI